MIEIAQTDEEKWLRAAAAKFIESDLPRAAVRELFGSESGLPEGYNRDVADMGWLSLLVPDSGGFGVAEDGIPYAAIVAEERGRGIQPGSFITTSVVIGALCRSGSEAQRTQVLPALVSGEQTATWVVTDALGTFAPDAGLTARLDGDGVVISGEALVQDAVTADWFLLTVAAPTGPTQVLLPRATASNVLAREGLDLTARFGLVRFDDVRARGASLVGQVGEASDDVEWQLRLAATLTAADSVGAMDAIFEMARQYALDRFAFGRPIGSFQAVKHQLADLSLNLEAARAATASAVEALSADRADAGEVVSIAKVWVSDVGIGVVQGCMQVFGGISQTWEHDVHLFLRRVAMNGLLYGGAEWHRERICRIHGLRGRGVPND